MHTSIALALNSVFGIAVARSFSGLHPLVWGSLLLLLGLSRARSHVRLCLLGFLIGASLFSLQMRTHDDLIEEYSAQLDDRELDLVRGRITGLPERLPGRVRVLVQTDRAQVWLTLYFEGERAFPKLIPGLEIEVLARLKSPTGLRGLGTVDTRMQNLARGADLMATAPLSHVEILDKNFSVWHLPTRLHDWSADKIESSGGPADGRHLVSAIAIGERGAMPKTLAQALRSSGIAHLLAVSGMHLAAVAGLVYFLVLVAWAWLPWRQQLEPAAVAALVSLLVAILFTGVTGARPSTCRALLVATFVLMGIVLDRRIRLLHAIAWAAFILLSFNPFLLWDPGFQMSFAAALALALAFAKDNSRLEFVEVDGLSKIRSRVYDLLRASFWASLATAPIALHHFGQVAWVGLLTNLVAVPVATLILLPLSLASLVVLALHQGAGECLLDLAVHCANGIAYASRLIDSWFPAVSRPPMNLFEFILWLGVILVLLQAQRRIGLPRLSSRKRIGATLVLVLLFSASRYYWGDYRADHERGLRVTFVDVGQGDAAVVELPGGKVWLVDGGGLPFVSAGTQEERQFLGESPARRSLLPYLRHRRIKSIDLAILSHPHPDHYLGLQAVAREMPIGELWSVHEKRAKKGQFETWLAQLEASGTRVLAPGLGMREHQEGVRLEVLWPRYGESTHAEADPILSVNDNSLVVRLEFAGRVILFTGDIEAEAEELLVSEFGQHLHADVVKVPHHGSPTSSSAALVAATQPVAAVISCGIANRFHFPDSGVLERWQERALHVLRTDQVGSIKIEIARDGELRIETIDPM